jgi:hypothetical protein
MTDSPGEVRTIYFGLKRQTNLVDAQDSEHKTAACKPSSSSSSPSSSSLPYGPYSFNQCLLQREARTELHSVSFLPLTPIAFRSLSIQSNHHNFGLPTLLPPSAFPRNTFYCPIVRKCYQMTSQFMSSYFNFCYNIWFILKAYM